MIEGCFSVFTNRSSFCSQLSASNDSQLIESHRRPGSSKATHGRSSSLCIREESEEADGKRIRSVSDGEMFTKRTENEPVVNLRAPLFKSVANSDTLVVIDNSNVFIGAREAACMLNPKLRPRHIKVRLQALTEVLEHGRNVTKRFVCGSSPPANENVWDVYRQVVIRNMNILCPKWGWTFTFFFVHCSRCRPSQGDLENTILP